MIRLINKTILRKAKLSDSAFLFQLRKLTMVEHLENAGLFLSDVEHKFRVEDEFNVAHILLIENQRVGMVKYDLIGSILTVKQLQILPRFQNKGLGSKILGMLFKQADNTQADVKLTVLKQNPALKLYQKLGFVIDGEDDFEYFMTRKYQAQFNVCINN